MSIPFEPSHRFLVTGASSGIGRGVTRRLVELGATVLATGRDAERLDATKNACAAPERCVTFVRDLVADLDGAPAWVVGLAAEHGPLSGIVHCAGVLRTTPLRVLSLDVAAQVMDVNFFSFLMLARGLAHDGVADPRGASLLVLSSVASLRGLSSGAAYAASKGAVNAAVVAMATELTPQRIRCNAVLPGVVETEMTQAVPADQLDYLLAQQFIPGRIQSQDVADACAFLLSDCAAFITGQLFVVDAGCGAIPGPRPLV